MKLLGRIACRLGFHAWLGHNDQISHCRRCGRSFSDWFSQEYGR